MKIQIASDLHWDMMADRSKFQEVLPVSSVKADILLLVGDMTGNPGDFEYLTKLPIPILYILGNHEYYGYPFPDRLNELKAYFQGSNIHVLNNEIFMLDGIKFICSTMWTDLNHGMHNRIVKQCMNDLHVIKGFTVTRWLQEYDKARDYIKFCLGSKLEGERTTVVVTHHAPSYKSEQRHFGSAISGGFCAHMDDVIEHFQPPLWVHGHTHDPVDYFIGKTRVVTNPKGYDCERGLWEFQKEFIIELE